MTALRFRGSLPPVSRETVLRYMRSPKEESDAIGELLDLAIAEGADAVSPSLVYLELPVERDGDAVFLGSFSVVSRTLSSALSGASRMVVFSATVGHALDRLVARYSHTSPARALALSAFGTERVEALADAFCAGYPSAGMRVSPGYGDLPLALSRELLAMLGADRSLGITLTDGGLMNPKKTVTAIFGVK